MIVLRPLALRHIAKLFSTKFNKSHKILAATSGVLAGLIGVTAFGTLAFSGQEVNIYSFRQPKLIAPLVEDFQKTTGIKVNILFSKKGLVERIHHEGKNSPADVLLTTGIGQTNAAVTQKIAQSVSDKDVLSNIPSSMRGKNDEWFGLTSRARVVYASKKRAGIKALNYQDLADPKWKGKICIRPGHHVYNVALIAAMIAHKGEADTKKWLTGFRQNLARKPQGNDRLQVKGVYSGLCDLAIGNTYYMGLMQTNEKSPEQKLWASSVNVIFPTFQSGGTHVNLSSMLLTKHAPNKDNALKFMRYLSSDHAQKIYAEENFEYPVKSGVAWSKTVKAWGDFKVDTIDFHKIAANRKRASELIDEVKFNEGPQAK